jgi:K+-transporting ATPase c subunit
MRAGMISERRLPTYKIALTAIAPTGLASVRFSHHANGSVLEKGGTVIGSELIGQTFTDDKYFHGRPSATTDTYPNDPTKTVSGALWRRELGRL